MNRADMLAALGLSDYEFTDMLQKFNSFMASLDANQQKVIQASIPSAAQAAASFGSNVSPADVQNLVTPPVTTAHSVGRPTTVMFFALAAK
ncbi:MAG TPA: hypothetical protein VII23_05195 [Terriglobales bacterium]